MDSRASGGSGGRSFSAVGEGDCDKACVLWVRGSIQASGTRCDDFEDGPSFLEEFPAGNESAVASSRVLADIFAAGAGTSAIAVSNRVAILMAVRSSTMACLTFARSSASCCAVRWCAVQLAVGRMRALSISASTGVAAAGGAASRGAWWAIQLAVGLWRASMAGSGGGRGTAGDAVPLGPPSQASASRAAQWWVSFRASPGKVEHIRSLTPEVVPPSKVGATVGTASALTTPSARGSEEPPSELPKFMLPQRADDSVPGHASSCAQSRSTASLAPEPMSGLALALHIEGVLYAVSRRGSSEQDFPASASVR
mmetsp:Transcript_29142/g.89265  ORF Transcript_29142/g.89265 Transcript_29142/m.89265 type:complete len:312 (-) Transcript_29142:872-1807(-)